MPKPKLYEKNIKFNLSTPHADKVRKWAAEDRRSFTETLRIIIDFYEANALPHPNGAHEPCNQSQ